MADRAEDALDSRPTCYSTSPRYDVQFTKTGCTPVSCICIIVAFMFVALGAAAGVYFGLHFLGIGSDNNKIFKGKFIVINGDNYTRQLDDVLSHEFQKKAYFYQNILDKLYNTSSLKDHFRQSEILAFGRDDKGLLVHFNLHLIVDESNSITATDLYVVLIEEVRKRKSNLLKGIRIDYESIHVEERIPGDHTPTVWTLRRHYPGYLETPTTTQITPVLDVRKCIALHIDFCTTLPYNQTSYPNLVGHESVKEATHELVRFRQIVDFECYPFAQELICQLLQPDCKDNKLTYPCRDFCEEFLDSCRSMLRPTVVESINCTQFPKPPDQCRDKTGNIIRPLK
ncbi:uncharacterized protein [Centruroides vittatus]|uniref:uncharacterized protein n=1 Tax=Centruroides vittatus TaxID=120091 RepID=UPI00350FA96E